MKWGILTTLAFLVPAQMAMAISLDEYLQQVAEKNGLLKAVQSGKEAAEAKREAGDIGLSPILTLQARRLDDKKPMAGGPGFTINQTSGSDYSVSLSKKFSTGTDAMISGTAGNIGAYFPNGSGGLTGPDVSSGLRLQVSQSLWKNFFGHGIRLRQEREGITETLEKQALDVQGRQILISAEAAFWDYLYQQDEARQREESLARAKKIEGWMRNRASNGIGDRADVLKIQGLVALREVELLQSRDALKVAEEKLRTTLELPAGEKFPVLTAELHKVRTPEAMVTSSEVRKLEAANVKSGDIVALNAYMAMLEARARSVGAKEAEDGMRPDLVVEGQYGTNAYESTWGTAFTKMSDATKPTMGIGVKFVYMLDGGLKESTRRAARMEALAASHRQERALMESESSWREYLRRHKELTAQVQAVEKLSQVQTSKAAAERDKFSKGRSVTAEVVTAEQDASESTLQLMKLRAEHRKMEAQARMFVRLQEAP